MAVDACGQKSSIDVAQIKRLWSSLLPDWFERMSFGYMGMPNDPRVNYILPQRLTIGCTGERPDGNPWYMTPPDYGNLWGMGFAADTDAWNTYKFDVYKYDRHVYIMPESFGTTSYGFITCPTPLQHPDAFTGLVSTDKTLMRAMLHELGHTLGLNHAQAYDSAGNLLEYGDDSCIMSIASDTLPPRYNAPHSVQLGWVTPQAVLGEAGMPVGKWLSFKLTGLADSPVNSLQIWPSWSASGWNPGDLLYVSFRRPTPTNTDAYLFPQYRNKVQVHSLRFDSYGCGPSALLGQLDDPRNSTGQSQWPRRGSTLPQDLLSPMVAVRVVSIDPTSGYAQVSVCRASQWQKEYGSQCSDGVDNDCDGQVDNC